MKKTLYLIRHAKSSWDDTSLRDHDRPLNKRGKRDAPFMAKVLRKNGVKPDLIISSTAVRALDFAKMIAEELNYSKKEINATKELYMADEKQMLEILRSADDSFKTVFIVGHNPYITEFANSLCNHNLDNIPTSGIFCVEFDAKKWKEIDFGKGKFVSFDYPKKYY
ncbi:MAG TPA: histidine phosphatase family protein [Ignavibacteria bacterium]|nr:histidine phosphatase family protein [Ignavibacteria bacterium]